MWSTEGERIDLPTSFKNLKIAVEVGIRSVWCTSSMWGLIYQTENLMICESEMEPVCPFKTMMVELKEHETMEEDGMSST